MDDTAKLTVGHETIDLPTFRGTENELGIDIGSLRAKTGAVTHDNGFANTAPCRSGITFLNGEQGILRYSGYPIEQLSEQSSFTEVARLLLTGELPIAEELDRFHAHLAHHSELHTGMHGLFAAFPATAHPMAVLSSAVAGWPLTATTMAAARLSSKIRSSLSSASSPALKFGSNQVPR